MPANSHSRGQSQAQKKAHSCQIAASCSQLMRRGMTLQRLQQRFADCIASSSVRGEHVQAAGLCWLSATLLASVCCFVAWVGTTACSCLRNVLPGVQGFVSLPSLSVPGTACKAGFLFIHISSTELRQGHVAESLSMAVNAKQRLSASECEATLSRKLGLRSSDQRCAPQSKRSLCNAT